VATASPRLDDPALGSTAVISLAARWDADTYTGAAGELMHCVAF